MPAPHNRKITVRNRNSPKGKPVIKHKAEKQAKAVCSLCGKLLGGMPNRSHAQMAKLSKTQKRPERKFGGILCTTCVAQVIKDKVRLQQGLISKDEIDFRRLKFITSAKHSLQ